MLPKSHWYRQKHVCINVSYLVKERHRVCCISMGTLCVVILKLSSLQCKHQPALPAEYMNSFLEIMLNRLSTLLRILKWFYKRIRKWKIRSGCWQSNNGYFKQHEIAWKSNEYNEGSIKKISRDVHPNTP